MKLASASCCRSARYPRRLKTVPRPSRSPYSKRRAGSASALSKYVLRTSDACSAPPAAPGTSRTSMMVRCGSDTSTGTCRRQTRRVPNSASLGTLRMVTVRTLNRLSSTRDLLSSDDVDDAKDLVRQPPVLCGAPPSDVAWTEQGCGHDPWIFPPLARARRPQAGLRCTSLGAHARPAASSELRKSTRVGAIAVPAPRCRRGIRGSASGEVRQLRRRRRPRPFAKLPSPYIKTGLFSVRRDTPRN